MEYPSVPQTLQKGSQTNWDILLLDSAGAISPLVQHAASDTLIGWTGNRDRLLFMSNRGGPNGIWSLPFAADGHAGEPLQLLLDVGPMQPFGLSSRGSLLYCVSQTDMNVYTAEIDVDSGRLVSGPRQIDWPFEGFLSFPSWQEGDVPAEPRNGRAPHPVRAESRGEPGARDAFAPPRVIGQLGNSPIGPYRLPGINNWDLSFMKNFPGLRVADHDAEVQLRVELFNAFNHTQFMLVDNNFNASGVKFDSSGLLTNWTQANPNFGRVTRIREPREMQTAIRLTF